MFRIWNVVLICVTFLLTIFGTFLTRSGLIASVHSFAKSDIGPYFLYYLALLASAALGLIVWRLPKLRGKTQIESIISREGMFVINNWALLGGMTFILCATLSPVFTEAFTGHEITVGPPFYNKWMAPIGLLIFALMGLAPLFGWRKTSKSSLKSAFLFPAIAFFVTAILHFSLGGRLDYPAIVATATVEPGIGAQIYGKISSFYPGLTVALSAMNIAVVIQEFVRGTKARMSSTEKKGEAEGALLACLRLVQKSRRRYGGYIVHLGIVGMFLGFVGTAWTIEDEVSLNPGESHVIADYTLTYDGTRMCPGNPKCSTEEQSAKGVRMLFADVTVHQKGQFLTRLSPAKFIYQSPPQTTSEVGLLRGFRDDLYLVLATADPKTKRSTFTFHVNPFVGWIWIGLGVLIFGCFVSLWPEVSAKRVTAWTYVRTGLTATAGILMTVFFANSLSRPFVKSLPVERPLLVSSLSDAPLDARSVAPPSLAEGVSSP